MHATTLTPTSTTPQGFEFLFPRFPGYISDMYLFSSEFESIDVLIGDRVIYSIPYSQYVAINDPKMSNIPLGNKIPLMPAYKYDTLVAPVGNIGFSHLCYTGLRLRITKPIDPNPSILVLW
jgi:hypothetical protein